MSPEEYRQIRYEIAAPGVARITLARPEKRNAQGERMTYELDAALHRAARDEAVNAILLAAAGPHFSAGHDFSETFEERFPRAGSWGPLSQDAPDALFHDEMEVFLEMCERWRNLSKPTIALVNGKCIAGGLMLAWACDLIIAADDASFLDPTIDMGVMGVESFVHAFELGVRQAKEFLFAGEWLSAGRAHQLGMVNRVVPAAELGAAGLELATRIARKPGFAVRAAKLAINQAEDSMGRWQALRHGFALHHLTHANNRLKYGTQIDPAYARGIAGERIAGLDEKIAGFGPKRGGA